MKTWPVVVFLLSLIGASSQLLLIDEDFFSYLNGVYEDLSDSHANYSKVINNVYSSVEKVFGSSQGVLSSITELRIPAPPRLRHKRQILSTSLCDALASQVSALNATIAAVQTHGAELASRLATANATLSSIDSAQLNSTCTSLLTHVRIIFGGLANLLLGLTRMPATRLAALSAQLLAMRASQVAHGCVNASQDSPMCEAFSTLLPQVDANVNNLKALQAEVNNSTANAACLDPIKAQINDLMANPPQVSSLNLSPEAFAQMAAVLGDNVTAINASYQQCVIDSQTTTAAPTTAVPISKYPLPNTCVTWKPYLNDTAPATDGYRVGNFTDGSEVYVGYSYVSGQNSQPGRLRIEQPALYLTIPQNTGTIIHQNILYMSLSPNCTCSWETIDFNTPGIIMLGMVLQGGSILNTPFFVSKIDLGGGAVTIARSRLDFNAYYYAPSGTEGGVGGIKTALACNPQPGTTTELQPIVGGTVTDTLLPNQCLFYGHGLTSASGCFSLTFRVDGNVVITRKGDPTVIYDTKTTNKAAFQTCLLKSPGNLVVYASGDVVFDTKTSGATSLVLGNDGNLVLLAGTTKIWNSNSTQVDITC